MYEYKGWHFPDIDTHFQNSVGDYPETWYQQNTINIALAYVKNFNCVIDVGANIGLHTVRFAQKFKNVYSFEPVKSNFMCLQENTKKFHNVKSFKNGIGESVKKLDIKIPQGTTNCGAYSFVDFEDFDNTINETIDVVTIDSYNLVPDLIKIDTQGFEKQVLLGATNTLKNHSPVVITEIETKQEKTILEKIFQDLGYSFAERYRRDYIWIKK